MRLAPVILLGLFVIACASGDSRGSEEGFSLRGVVMVTDYESSWASASQCVGERSYSDLFVGQTVKVQDGAGQLLATGSLTAGSAGEGSEASMCSLLIEVDGIPRADSYVVFVGSRGPFVYTFEEMDEREQWSVSYGFGD